MHCSQSMQHRQGFSLFSYFFSTQDYTSDPKISVFCVRIFVSFVRFVKKEKISVLSVFSV